MTIKELQEIINNIPLNQQNNKITIERIEDVYFDKHGWTTIKVKDDYHNWDNEFILAESAIYENDLNILCIKAHY